MTLVYDRFDSPWGTVKHADSSGHSKPSHLQNAVATVQDTMGSR